MPYVALLYPLAALAFFGLGWAFFGEALQRASHGFSGERRALITRRLTSSGSPPPLPERRHGRDRRRHARFGGPEA